MSPSAGSAPAMTVHLGDEFPSFQLDRSSVSPPPECPHDRQEQSGGSHHHLQDSCGSRPIGNVRPESG